MLIAEQRVFCSPMSGVEYFNIVTNSWWNHWPFQIIFVSEASTENVETTNVFSVEHAQKYRFTPADAEISRPK